MVRGEPDWTKRIVLDVAAQIDPVPVAFEIEGDYETWEKLWDMAFPDGLYDAPSFAGIFSEDYLYLIWLDGGFYRRFAIYKLQDGSQVFLSPSGANYAPFTPPYAEHARMPHYNIVQNNRHAVAFSIRGRYVVFTKYTEDVFEVWKKGVKVFTSPTAAETVSGATRWFGVGISFDGKWIIAYTDNDYLVCFKGKP